MLLSNVFFCRVFGSIASIVADKKNVHHRYVNIINILCLYNLYFNYYRIKKCSASYIY